MNNQGIKQTALNFWEAIEQTFVENTRFLFSLFFLNYFTMAWSLLLSNEEWLALQYGCILFFAVVLLTAFLWRILSPLWLGRVQWILLFISVLPFPVEIFVMHTYKALIGAGIVNSILETNRKEAAEFIEMYVTWRELAVAVFCVVALYLVWKFSHKIRILERRKQVFCRGLAVAGIISLGWILFSNPSFFANPLLPARNIVFSISYAI